MFTAAIGDADPPHVGARVLAHGRFARQIGSTVLGGLTGAPELTMCRTLWTATPHNKHEHRGPQPGSSLHGQRVLAQFRSRY